MPVQLAEQCAGLPRLLDASELARPLLGSILQSGWGVSASDVAWSAAHDAPVTQLLWAIGPTPFGAYSARAQLSFALRDAATRAPLHAVASEVIYEVRQMASFFSEFHKSVDEILTASEHLRFLRRLNLLTFKLQRAQSYLSLHSFRNAQHYLLSTWHDLEAMRQVLNAAADVVTASATCG
jgi:hypothetical protein